MTDASDAAAAESSLDHASAAWPDPVEWADLRDRSQEARLARVYAEAERYRDARDEHWERLVELQDRVAALSAEIKRAGATRAAEARAAKRELAKTRRQLKRSRQRIRDLENSRAVRLARLPGRARRSISRRFGRAPVPGAVETPSKPPETPRVEADHETTSSIARAAVSEVFGSAVVSYWSTRGRDSDELASAEGRASSSGRALRQKIGASGRPLRVAAVVDAFTAQSLTLECDLIHLHPDSWEEEISEQVPDLLFVESAWRGHDGSWHNTVPGVPDTLTSILAWSRESSVPTVFWNKEDPVHFQTFLRLAREFDHVFTTDIDCLPRYRDALGHDRVHFLPFACQPRLQNPIETRERLDALAFAGGYYTRYPERMRDLAALLTGAAEVLPVHIWDRELGTTLDAYRFPPEYEKYIVGTLAASDIEVAYKGYRFALNLNSVKHSQSMFARRAYELLASGTITVSNYSRGVRVMLGDLIPMSDSSSGTGANLARLRSDGQAYDRLRLQGLRKVHSEHTYADRLRYLTSRITGDAYALRSPLISVVAPVRSSEQAAHLLSALRSQRGVTVTATFISDDDAARRLVTEADFEVLSVDEIQGLHAEALVGDGEGLAVLHPDDWYGPTYLQDLVLAWGYSDAQVVGRSSYAEVVDGIVVLRAAGAPYRSCSGLVPRGSVIKADACGLVEAIELLDASASALADLTQFTVDRFDYCRGGASAVPEDLAEWIGSDDCDQGADSAQLFAMLDERLPSIESRREVPVFDRSVFAAIPSAPELRVTDIRQGIRFQTSVEKELPNYRWLEPALPVTSEHVRIHLDYDGDLNLMMGGRFFDSGGQTLTSFTGPAHQNLELPAPSGAATVALAIRTQGTGTSVIRSLFLNDIPLDPPVPVTESEVLIITDHYPNYGDLYRNGFLHTRVRAYRAHGLRTDVFRPRHGHHLRYHEFEGVEVTSGSWEALDQAIRVGNYRTIVVHFMSERLWQVLREHVQSHRILVWVHGAEIQPWWRREFDAPIGELESFKARSDARVEFWSELASVSRTSGNIEFVFVSEGFAREIQVDYQNAFDPETVHVIHNPVDTDLFAYEPKGAELRKKILSVRSYATPKYANDVAVEAVVQLSQEPWFSDLEFCFVGDGPLFESTVEPLRAMPNVTLRQEFLPHQSLVELQREFGVFLSPSRWDSQGVSRDEAMATGLVPVTSDAGAISEFVSESEGFLLPVGDAAGTAAAIAALYENPEVFQAKSQASAARVRAQSSLTIVLPDEIALIRRGD